jgi:1,4-alpha-glucan branching enzyme
MSTSRTSLTVPAVEPGRQIGQPRKALARLATALLAGDEYNPFAVLGMHKDADSNALQVRVFRPDASEVTVIERTTGKEVATLPRLHDAGFFAGPIEGRSEPFSYQLKLKTAWGEPVIDDPYAFGPTLGELDLYLHAEGNYTRAYEKMGAHCIVNDGVKGVNFAVWAPNAKRVSVVGDFNAWDGRRNIMRLHPGAGIWEIFLPGIDAGACYKYEIKTRGGAILLKADPFAFQAERPPQTASVVRADLAPEPIRLKGPRGDRQAPVAIYEVHLGSWQRVPEEGNRSLTYRELADRLVPYVKDMGYTHIELLPVSEHPFDGSWGYQPTALFAPTSRFGTPNDFQFFVERCHAEGIGLILDWAAGHFPTDSHGLGTFDGSHLYEHANPKEGYHPDWNTLIYNFGRNEVRGFLLSNALFWLKEYCIDGLRVDAVASMLYRNYSRKEGEWIPNIYGGVENLEAIHFVRKLNELAYVNYPEVMTIAEESTAWPMVSRPTYLGGLGFGYKWNMGWMHDTLEYMRKEPVHRKFHHNNLTFGLLYAFTENFILPLSHDEVVHGKGSLLDKMPGDGWQKFANLRAYYAFQYTMPGKKLLFMGGEFAQGREWNHDDSLDWHLTELPQHAGVRNLVRDLNRLYRGRPALHERDCEPEGFSWIDCNDADASVISYIRQGAAPGDFVVVVCNFTPIVRENYRIGVPQAGRYREILNTDSEYYGGSNAGNCGILETGKRSVHGRPASLSLTLPPLGVLVLAPEAG